VITDSKNERTFVKELDTSTEVVVYAKLPRRFFTPTPVGNYKIRHTRLLKCSLYSSKSKGSTGLIARDRAYSQAMITGFHSKTR
jgi:hypothetical protein